MSKYKVKSGSLDVTIKAVNHRMAAIKAIDKYRPKELGMLISVIKEGDSLDDEIFMKAQFVLECMGFEFE